MKMKVSLKIVYVFLIFLALIWMAYGLFGDKVIQNAYEGESVGFLNKIIKGQEVHSVGHYLQTAERGVKKVSVSILILCFILFYIYLMQISKKVLAFSFGILICFVMIFSVEGVLRLIKFNEKSRKIYPEAYYTTDGFGIKSAKPGRHKIILKNNKTDQLIYEVHYSIDENHRRITSLDDMSTRDRFLLFIGCSFTFGEGLDDDQTLPFEVGKITTQYTPYNYAFHGQGPFDFLAKLENIDLREQIHEQKGILVYPFIGDHIHRTIGTMGTMRWRSEEVYYREGRNGKLIRDGSFATARWIRTPLYRFLSKSKILRFLGVSFPLKINDEHIEFTAKVIKQMEYYFKKKYPESEFYVLIYPEGETMLGNRMMAYLDEMDIKYLDYSGFIDLDERKNYIAEEDKHPSNLANQVIARRLVKDLALQETQGGESNILIKK